MPISKATGKSVAPAAKGDLVVGSATNDAAVLGVGSTGQVLTVDSSTTTGVKWATADALPSQTGNSGKYLTTNGTTASWGTVNQPITWTQRLGAQSVPFNKVEYNGSNLYVAVGNQGLLYTSSDAITWTSRTSGFGGNNILDVAFGNNLWVIVGEAGLLSTSSDGITWTARTANVAANQLRAVTYANSLWVAVGFAGGTTNTGGITYSSDGVTWTRKSQSLTVGDSYYSVVWNGTNWIVGATSATNNHLYASTPSGTWTVGQSGSGGTIYKIIWDGTRHTTFEGTGTEGRYSTSATLGTTTALNQTHRVVNPGVNGNWYYYNNLIYICTGIYFGTMTPGSTAQNFLSTLSIAPGRTSESTPYFEQQQAPVFAGSLGVIVAARTGIYTSF